MGPRFKKTSTVLATILVTSLAVSPAGAGSMAVPTDVLTAAGDVIVKQVDHKQHKRRDPNDGKVIAGAILFGILGVAAAASADNHYNDHYYDHHEDYVRASDRNFWRAARDRYHRTLGGRARAETRHVTYRGGNRYEVTARVRRSDGSRPRRFVCNTRV